jgi:hypothetical protein
MSWTFSRAQVAEFLADTCSDGERSAPWSKIPTVELYCVNAKTTGPLIPSRFGTTSERLTDDLGVELLTWWRAVSHARISAPPDPERGSAAPGPACGAKWRESFAKYDPDTCLWRTRQFLLLGDLEPFSGTWPRRGMMRNGECMEPLTPERRTTGTGCGFFATPAAADARGTHGGGQGRSLRTDVRMFPTPKSSPSGPDYARSGRPKSGSADLASFVALFPTPTVSGNYNREGVSVRSRDGLATHVKKYPTPAARDYRSPNKKPYQQRGGKKKGEQLPNVVGGQLNPDWVEWLMGWPIGWTALEPLEMDRFQQWLDSHGRI